MKLLCQVEVNSIERKISEALIIMKLVIKTLWQLLIKKKNIVN